MSFEIGDRVRHPSNGLEMTVTEIGPWPEGGSSVCCVWSEGNMQKQGVFPPEALIHLGKNTDAISPSR